MTGADDPSGAQWRWWRERRLPALRAANGQEIAGTRARLLDEHGIVTTAGAVTRAPRDMTEPLLRISPHVDCTPEDLARLRQALLALG